MDASPDERGIHCLGDHKEDIYSEIYRSTWLKVLGDKLEALGDSREDFGKRCNLVRQAYMEVGDIVLKAARRGSIASPYFLPWDEFWRTSPPEFDLWSSIRYYGRMPLYPQYPILNYFVDFGDPWQRIGIEADGRSYHDEGKDLHRDEELFELGWKVFRIPAVQTRPGYLGPDDEFRELDERAQRARLSRWLLETSDGVIRALKVLYYERWTPLQYATWYGLSEEMGDLFIQRCYQTLERHRLVTKFELPNPPDGNGSWKPWKACFE
jgi:Protein of unknown function (DUF559)